MIINGHLWRYHTARVVDRSVGEKVLQRRGKMLLPKKVTGRLQTIAVAVAIKQGQAPFLFVGRHFGRRRRRRLGFVAFSAPQKAPVLEHAPGVGVEGPVGALAGSVRSAGHFDEAVVEAQIVTERILPTFGVFTVEGKTVHDELVNVCQGQHPLRGALDGHGGERDVGVGRFLFAVRVAAGSWHD